MKTLLWILFPLLVLLPAHADTYRTIGADFLDSGAKADRNYIKNSEAEVNARGWAAYSDGSSASPVDGTGGTPSVSASRNTSTPLSGSGDFLFSKGGSNYRGQGISYDFTLDYADYTPPKVQTISFNYRVGGSFTYNAGTAASPSDVVVYIYAKDSGTLIQPDRFTLDGSGKYVGQFQPLITDDDYRLILHVATTNSSTWSFYFDSVSIGPVNTPRGPPVTDWTTYTPTWTSSGTAPVVGNGTLTGRWRRVGDTMEVLIELDSGNTTSWGSANGWSWSLPSGYTIDTNKVSTVIYHPLGNATAAETGGTQYTGSYVAYASSTTVQAVNEADGLTWRSTKPFAWAATTASQRYKLTFRIPIVGWGTNLSVGAMEEGRAVAATAHRNSSNQTGVNPNNSTVKIALNSTDSSGGYQGDTHGAFDTTNNRFVAPISGYYTASGAIFVNSTNVLASAYRAVLYINGTARTFGQLVIPAVSTAFSVTVAGGFRLNAGDYIELFIEGAGNNSASTLTVSGNQLYTYLNINRSSNPATPVASESVLAGYGAGSTTIGTSDTLTTQPTQIMDTHNAYNTSTGVFTCPVSGRYRVIQAFLSGTSVSTTTARQGVLVFLYKNGSMVRFLGEFMYQVTGVNLDPNGNFSAIEPCNAGDQLSIYMRRGSGVTSFDLFNDAKYTYTFFEKVGNF